MRAGASAATRKPAPAERRILPRRWHCIVVRPTQGLAEAQNAIGGLYDDGLGVPKDPAEAVRHYRLAADQGIAAAQTQLALHAMDGNGTAANDEEAFRWFNAAAAQNDGVAELYLALLYVTGRGTTPDRREATRWLKLAADSDVTEIREQARAALAQMGFAPRDGGP